MSISLVQKPFWTYWNRLSRTSLVTNNTSLWSVSISIHSMTTINTSQYLILHSSMISDLIWSLVWIKWFTMLVWPIYRIELRHWWFRNRNKKVFFPIVFYKLEILMLPRVVVEEINQDILVLSRLATYIKIDINEIVWNQYKSEFYRSIHYSRIWFEFLPFRWVRFWTEPFPWIPMHCQWFQESISLTSWSTWKYRI